MSINQAQREISAREFAEWMAYATIEPFGEERADLRIGILSAMVANALRGKGGRTYSPADFILTPRDHETPSIERERAMLNQFVGRRN